MTITELMPVIVDAPFVNPSPSGLYAATTWTEGVAPTRFLANGVQIRPWNYGGENSFGVWGAPWCGEPGSDENDLKTGVRPDMNPDPFLPVTVWSYDECDATAPSRAEVTARAQQVLRLEEQAAVEASFADRLLDDATVIASAGSMVDALGYLEGEIAKTNTIGVVHVGAQLAASAAFSQVLVRTGTGLKTPLNNSWVFGGGYVTALGNTLVATSPVFGWRDDVQVRTVLKPDENVFAAVAERSVVVGYEKLIAAVTITDGSV